jgi:hypothetical protein
MTEKKKEWNESAAFAEWNEGVFSNFINLLGFPDGPECDEVRAWFEDQFNAGKTPKECAEALLQRYVDRRGQ